MATAISQIAEMLDQDLPEENYRRVMQKLEAILLERRELRDPITFLPSDDEPDFPVPVTKPANADSPHTDQLPQKTYCVNATLHPKEVCHLRIDAQLVTFTSETTSTETHRPNSANASQDCCTTPIHPAR